MKKVLIGVIAIAAMTLLFFFIGEIAHSPISATPDHTADRVLRTPLPRSSELGEWQTFIRDSKRIIESNKRKIDVVREKLEEAGPKELLLFAKRVDVLEEKNQRLKDILEDFESERSSEWREFRLNFQRDIDRLEMKIDSVEKVGG